jgi:hypothetical protein
MAPNFLDYTKEAIEPEANVRGIANTTTPRRATLSSDL